MHGKRRRSCSRDDDCWGVHPELPYVAHSHNSRCSVCTEYGAHLALASAAQLRTYQRARYNLIHLQDRLLQCRSIKNVDRMLRHVEADNEDLRSDNAHLQEENDELKARLASMGPLQPQPTTADAPLRAPSSFRGRAREQEHPQHQSMGYPPTTHHHDTQGKPPTHEDMCLTTSNQRCMSRHMTHSAQWNSTDRTNRAHFMSDSPTRRRRSKRSRGSCSQNSMEQNTPALSASLEKNGQRGNSKPSSSE